ncbi:hypothetical protein [Anaerotruncus rubiinfantis]|uniref:hypothetical protein n=1 Tax=Anaerotruncus rubiinfantis TaxID=1720200 RepID=UPI0018993E20|nr:hypothetical protein [Anaerotruncus rubiinfantis]
MNQAIPVSNEALGLLILAAVADDNEFIDQKPTGRRLGNRLTIVASGVNFAPIVVRTSETTLPISQEELNARNRAGNFAVVSADGLVVELKQDWRTKENRLYGVADRVVIANGKEGKIQ